MKIAIVAGESSGDLHAANLARSIRKKVKDAEFFGYGGIEMQLAGVKIEYDLTKYALVGFTEVVKHWNTFKALLEKMALLLEARKPDCLILVDYPGFNLKLAEIANKLNIPVIYYISPQVWGWGKGRIKTIKRTVKKVIVILPFEEDFYKKYSIDASFVGHPLVDSVRTSLSREKAKRIFGFEQDKNIVGLFPGSREQEVKRLLPVMNDIVKEVSLKLPDTQWILALSKNISKDLIKEIIGRENRKIKIAQGNPYDVMNISDAMIMSSGTATLEASLFEVPFVVMYKVSFLTYLFFRAILKIPYISLPNIIANKKIVPEYIQYGARSKRISRKIVEYLTNNEIREKMKNELKTVKGQLGQDGASDRAAEIVINTLNNNKG